MGNTIIERLEPSDVSDELTQYLQTMALAAWSRALPHRTVPELLTQFNPYKPSHLERAQSIYQSFAQEGGFLVAMEDSTGIAMPVGYLLIREEVAGSEVVQRMRRRFHPGQVHVLIQHLVVAVEEQRKGTATRLTSEGLEGFSENQVPLAYVFQEHTLMMEGVQKYGYSLDPYNQKPTELKGFFGPRVPVQQFRFTAPSVASVLERLRTDLESA